MKGGSKSGNKESAGSRPRIAVSERRDANSGNVGRAWRSEQRIAQRRFAEIDEIESRSESWNERFEEFVEKLKSRGVEERVTESQVAELWRYEIEDRGVAEIRRNKAFGRVGVVGFHRGGPQMVMFKPPTAFTWRRK